MKNIGTEKWERIQGFPDYEVSNFGRIKSLQRTVKCGRSGFRVIKEKILVSFICKQTGYRQITLNHKKKNIHRLVACAFIGEPLTPSHQVNHINGDRANSCASNLEWVTPSENVAHGFRSNGRISPTKGKIGKESSNAIPIIATNIKTGKEWRFESGMDAVRVGFSSSGITRACQGKISKHKGYFWRLAK